MGRPPKVFISYSHDTVKHQERVLGLADRLRVLKNVPICFVDSGRILLLGSIPGVHKQNIEDLPDMLF
jgi:hypothetical protein